ncbi:MAG: DUF4389 domain-containing protein [Anaerolineaceae bacterium]
MTDPSDANEHLERLASLHAAGALTDEEFEAEKARTLAQSSPDETLASPPADSLPFPQLPGSGQPYPMAYDVEYPLRLSRWKTLFRLPLLLPAAIFLNAIQFLLFYALLPIGWTTVFWRKTYPKWLFEATTGSLAYTARFLAYALLQTDRYPSFDVDSSPVSLTFTKPPPGELSRWRVFFWKLVLLIPHFFVLGALQMALFVVTVIAWFGILFTGSYPRGLFGFTTGVMRWHYRVGAYFASLNDRFPPYALSAEAGPAGSKTVVWSGIGGGIAAAGLAALFTVAVIASNTADTEDILYSDLLRGDASNFLAYDGTDGPVFISLVRAYDPGNDLVQLLKPGTGEKVVVFEWTIRNASASSIQISADAAELKYSDGKSHRERPEIVVVGNGGAPQDISSRTTAIVRAAFVVPSNSTPLELDFQSSFTRLGGITYKFR